MELRRFFSPEQATRSDPSTRADIYVGSCTTTMVSAAAGRSRTRRHRGCLLEAHLTLTPPRPSIPRACPTRGADGGVDRAMAKAPQT
jgi:hypothetical protein